MASIAIKNETLRRSLVRVIIGPSIDRVYGSRSPRDRLEQGLNLRVESPSDNERRLTAVSCEEARHQVVGEVHAVGALVNEDRDRRVRRRVGNSLRHFLHDEWIP